MTSHWCDFQNTDYILHCGSNSSENHPISSKWLNKAHERGAKWIVVDSRYTRTAELADIYCPIRSGTDIAFYGGDFAPLPLTPGRWMLLFPQDAHAPQIALGTPSRVRKAVAKILL